MSRIKVGDKMECLTTTGNLGSKIVGKLYDVVDHYNDGDLGYIDEGGSKAYFMGIKSYWRHHPRAKTIDLSEVYYV